MACTVAGVAHLASPEEHSLAPRELFVSSGELVGRSPSTQANRALGPRYADNKFNSSAGLDHLFHRAVLNSLGDFLNLSVSEANSKGKFGLESTE